VALFPLLLKDIAAAWWDLQSEDKHTNWEDALAAFTQRFVDNDLVKWQKAAQFWTRVQGPGEVVDEYAASLRKSVDRWAQAMTSYDMHSYGDCIDIFVDTLSKVTPLRWRIS